MARANKQNKETTRDVGAPDGKNVQVSGGVKPAEVTGVIETSERSTGRTGDADGSATLAPHRYAGSTIKHFDHNGKIYQLVPNSVCRNLPADAEQVKRLIAKDELRKIS